jgi:RNA polymerase sigma-70 factor (ECF subfamily)
MTTDEELLAQWARGDEAAGEALFRRCFDLLYRFFRNKAPAAIDDLIQETMLACVEYRSRLANASSFRAYVLATARHVLFAYYRRSTVGEVEIEDSKVVELGPSPSQVVAEHSVHRLLLVALQSIPIRFQFVLELFYWEDLTPAELSEAAGLPLGTVRGRISRGRELLAKRLAELEQDPRLVEAITGDLERWAQGLRDVPARQRPRRGRG